jgi:hypothetical protein
MIAPLPSDHRAWGSKGIVAEPLDVAIIISSIPLITRSYLDEWAILLVLDTAWISSSLSLLRAIGF